MRKVDELRPLRLGRLLALWREYRESGDPLERAALCNGRVLAECCFYQGERVYRDEAEALEDLTAREMERLLLRLGSGGGPVREEAASSGDHPAFDPARFRALGGA